MERGIKAQRRNYFINASLQTRYILLCLIPALIIAVYSILLLTEIGKLLFIKSKNNLSLNMPEYIQTLKEIVPYSSEQGVSKIVKLQEELFSLQVETQNEYLANIREWENLKLSILYGETLALLCVGILALLYSHRVAGPMYRIKNYLEMLADGREIPPVRLRRYDEFKDVANALNKLRKSLKEKKAI